MATSNKKHAERRARLEAERAERRRMEEERLRKKNQKKKSASIPAKWYWKGGIRIAGTPVRGGFFYAGANMKDMIEPSISEPSLLNPMCAVADSADEASSLPDYPIYSLLSPEQRRGYIDFLSGDRTDAKDIGYVFLYIYGMERRLLLDARKPGEVTEEEKEDIAAELIRVRECFSQKSRSVAHYIDMLLLYDGTIFKMLQSEDIRALFELDDKTFYVLNKGRELTDNSDAYSYLLTARLIENKQKIPVYELISLGKGNLLRTSRHTINPVEKEELYSESLDKLLLERFTNTRFPTSDAVRAHKSMSLERPQYFPASPTIRKAKTFPLTSNICIDPETAGLPLKTYGDAVNQARLHIREAEKILATDSLRDINGIMVDALDALSPDNCALNTFLKNKHTATYVSMKTIDNDMRRRYGKSLTTTSKGLLTTTSQDMIAKTAASMGWQALLPETVESLASSSWKVNMDSKVVMFQRKTAHDIKNGRRCMNEIFGQDESSDKIIIPASWMEETCLAHIYAWFVAKCGDAYDKNAISKYSSRHYPKFTAKGMLHKNQVALFFSFIHACYTMPLSAHGLKNCLNAVDFADVQDLIFSLVNDTYGRMIPPAVMSALEELYSKAGQDKTMVLYDYQSADYHIAASTEQFVIDEDKMESVIADTGSVQQMLDDAIGNEVDDSDELLSTQNPVVSENSDIFDDIGENADAQIVSDGSELENDVENESSETASNSQFASIKEKILEFFDDDDEAQTSELLSFIVENGFASTTTDAMNIISSLNEYLEEELVEIDGADAYLN